MAEVVTRSVLPEQDLTALTPQKIPTKAELYEHRFQERTKCVEEILQSQARKKIVVAGPGTGKTYLFGRVLARTDKSLTLSFINDLVDTLCLELCGVSEVKTLHGFALSKLRNAKVFPKLSAVISQDAPILLGKTITAQDFDNLFHQMEEPTHESVRFYKNRKDYYAYYGHASIVYAIVQRFNHKPDKIPEYDLVVVDEFQDFNKLEVCLIEQLAHKSPILIAGDDDQALYDFKKASADFIRNHSRSSEYTTFNLPYCSRCTRVVVEAANDVIAAAKAKNLLRSRIEKPYIYFDCKEKDIESDLYPKITHTQAFDAALPWCIQKLMLELAEQRRQSFSVLVISPTRVKCSKLVSGLRKKGLTVNCAEADEKNVTLLDGLNLILRKADCNLGWRIAAEHLLDKDQFQAALSESAKGEAPLFRDLLEPERQKQINGLVRLLKRLSDDRSYDPDKAELQNLFGLLGIDPHDVARQSLCSKIDPSSSQPPARAIRSIPIQVTTTQKSKGLAADYVFITSFDERHLIKSKDKTQISDQDVCQFLVALTRAKRKLFLISASAHSPTFLDWIAPHRVERIKMFPLPGSE